MVTDAKRAGPSMGLAEAVLDIIDNLRGRPAFGGGSPDNWERIVAIIAEHDCLSDGDVKVIDKAIAEAYRDWSDARRRLIWYETDSGMTDDEMTTRFATRLPTASGMPSRSRCSTR
jgi:hypothetical protein